MSKEIASKFLNNLLSEPFSITGLVPPEMKGEIIIDYSEEGKEKTLKVAEIYLDGKVFISNLRAETPYILRVFERVKDDIVFLQQGKVLTKKCHLHKRITESKKNCILEVDVNKQRLPMNKLLKRVKALGIENLNILVLGGIGAGKSSFISTLQSIIKGKYDSQFALAGASDKTFTTKFQKLSFEGVPQVKILETFGIQKNNYEHILKPLLDGTLPEGQGESKDPLPDYGPATLQSRVHAVIFVMDANIKGEFYKERLDDITKIFNKIVADPCKFCNIFLISRQTPTYYSSHKS